MQSLDPKFSQSDSKKWNESQKYKIYNTTSTFLSNYKMMCNHLIKTDTKLHTASRLNALLNDI